MKFFRQSAIAAIAMCLLWTSGLVRADDIPKPSPTATSTATASGDAIAEPSGPATEPSAPEPMPLEQTPTEIDTTAPAPESSGPTPEPVEPVEPVEATVPTAQAEVATAQPDAVVAAPTLRVTSSVSGDYFQAGVGDYVFEGISAPGQVSVWWRNMANIDTSWKLSMLVATEPSGLFRGTAPIGPWEATIDWQVTSTTADISASAVVTTQIHPATRLGVTSSVGGDVLRAGTGSYVFDGSAPPGRVQVQWANLAVSPLRWGDSVSTTADAGGAFHVTTPIGPWEARFAWRAFSPDTPGTIPSPTVYTTIQPGVTLSVWSTTTGSRFVAGNGNYVFGGLAPQGLVSIWWRAPGTTSWRLSTTTQAWSTGTYRVEVPIGPWPGSVEWRATSTIDSRLLPSPTRLTVVSPATAAFTYSTRGATLTDLGAAYRSGCPVGPSSLTVITMNHWGFDGAVHSGGELIVRTKDVSSIVGTFRAGFDARFPIRKIVNPRLYAGAQDVLMMEDDNTSGFNCRQVVGNPYRTSPHSYGYAVDINPRENPYYAGGIWYPSSGSAYINRSTRRPGMHYSDTVFPRQFTSRGGHWGGLYSDYHHFETVPR